MHSASDQEAGESLFAGGGRMGELMRSIDWAATPVGPVRGWPQSLKTALSILLTQRTPVFIFWGPEHVQFYNDAYRPILGTAKHPAAMGQRGSECWPEIWDIIEPMLDAVHGGESTAVEDGLLVLNRYGYLEECYFNYTYSPIQDESGSVGGVFCVVYETTERVIGERRLRTLRDLASRSSAAKTAGEACQAAADTLAGNPQDVPFAAFYLFDSERKRATLVCATGIEAGLAASPLTIRLDTGRESVLAPAALASRTEVIEDLPGKLGEFPARAWPEPIESAIVLPLTVPGQALPAGFMVAGVSPRKRLDPGYRTFFELVAAQVATAVADARAYEEERRRAEALAELDRAKTAFFSNVSHEFRTPLTLILGPLESMLARTGEGTGERQELELMHRNGLRLLKLVNTLLDFARIEAGRIRASYQPLDLAALTEDLSSVFRSAIEKAGLRLVIDCPRLPEPAYVDRDMWEKIVLNLLSNALKFTFEGEIAVSLRSRDGCAELSVRDTGIGIPAEHLGHVFERFHRVEGARGRTQEGSGIGLALVQELVKLHGGSVSVQSDSGHGTVFTVSIPLGSAHLPASSVSTPTAQASTATSARSYVEEALRWLPESGQALAEIVEAPAIGDEPGLAPAGSRGARVLVADDNADMRDYLRRLLSDNYEVEMVADGEAALSAARARPPDLVLCDVMMPRLDGFGLLEALRTDPATSVIPVILVSARAGEEARIEGLERGADDYLVKPFGARELTARVSSRLEIARLRHESSLKERELRRIAEAERQRWRELFEQAPAVVAVLRGPDHVFELANKDYVRAVGRTDPKDLLGKPIREALPEVTGQIFPQLLDEVYRTGIAFFGNEYRAELDRHGYGTLEERYFNFVYQPSRNAAGAVEGILVHAVDVTEQVLARQRVEESERQMRTLADSIPQLAWMADPDGHVFWYNRRWYEFTGTTPDEMLGWGWQSVHDPKALPAVLDRWRSSIRTGEPFEMEFPLRRADGAYRWFLTRVIPVRDEPGRVVRWFGTNTDVTELREAQEALRQSEARFRQLADSMPQIVWVADSSGRWQYSNRRCADFCGNTADGQRVHFEDLLRPDERSVWREHWSRAVAALKPLQMECRLLDRNSGEHRYHLVRAVPVLEPDGTTARWYGTCTDIEDQKLAEEAIRQKQKLEGLGLLAGGVAHDFNNLLVGIMGSASLLLEDVPPGSRNRPLVEQVLKASERAADLTRQMLAYAGKGAFVLERLDVSAEVRETVALLRSAIPKKIAVNLALAARLPYIEADRGHIQQIVMNLVINAAEAIGGDQNGSVWIGTRQQTGRPAAGFRFFPEPPPQGRYVVLEVRDTGTGIPDRILANIFDPFFTTKFTGRGLGLAAVLGIVRRHEGAIGVQSVPGGTTFSVYIPAAEAGLEAAPGDAVREASGRRLVLVVDDEEVVRDTVRNALERSGYPVVTATNGKEAVEWYEQHPREAALVLLDLSMPVMDGEETLRALQQIDPDVPVVLSSGYDELEAVRRFPGRKLAGFLHKPYTAAELLKQLGSVLSAKAGAAGGAEPA